MDILDIFIQGRYSNLHDLWPATKDKEEKSWHFPLHMLVKPIKIMYSIVTSLPLVQSSDSHPPLDAF